MLQSAKVIGPCLVCIPNGLDEPTIVLKTERKRPLCFQQNENAFSNLCTTLSERVTFD